MVEEARDFETIDFVAVLQSLQETPRKLFQLIHGLNHSELRWRNSEGEFSALENICHLRDLEAEGYSIRIDRILAQSNPFLKDFDGARVAAERSYNDENADAALQAFGSARAKNIETLQSAAAVQLKREGTLEGVGPINLKRLAQMMREHDEGHIEDLRVLRQRIRRDAHRA